MDYETRWWADWQWVISLLFLLNRPDMDMFKSRKAIPEGVIKESMYEGDIEELIIACKGTN